MKKIYFKPFIIMSLSFLFISFTIYSQTNWVELVTGTSAQLNSISSMKEVSTWACGNNATIIKSTNSGDTWTNANQNVIPASINLVNIHAVSAQFALTAGYSPNNTYIFRTNDGGLNWEEVFHQENGRINAINMFTQTEGHCIGNPVGGRWSIWKTNDGGITWDSAGMYLPQSGNETGFENSMCVSGSGGVIWFGTNNYRIYQSGTGGNSWTFASTPDKDSRTIWLDYNLTPGYSGGSALIRTLNSGLNWQIVRTYGTGNIVGVTGCAFARFNWFVRNNNKIYFSPHYWSPWELSYTSPSGNYRYITIERNGFFAGAVFAIKDNGGITRTFFLSTIGINVISSEVAGSFSLSQNYPNPFNPTTTFKFSIPVKSQVNLKIYNSIGSEIETLLDNELSPAVYEANWDASKYSSGVYYYRLTTDNYTETRKMVLVK